jgi:predicted nucleic acid-binding protein
VSEAAEVLIDASAWIDVLRNRAEGNLSETVRKALHDGRAALAPPVWVELYRGVRGKRELARLESLRRLCRWLKFDETCWEIAAKISRDCREHGAAVPLGDILVYACARRHRVELVEQDQHFALIRNATK